MFDEADLVFTLGVFSDESGFWIGKASLRSWRQLALDQLEEDEEQVKECCVMGPPGPSGPVGPQVRNKKRH